MLAQSPFPENPRNLSPVQCTRAQSRSLAGRRLAVSNPLSLNISTYLSTIQDSKIIKPTPKTLIILTIFRLRYRQGAYSWTTLSIFNALDNLRFPPDPYFRNSPKPRTETRPCTRIRTRSSFRIERSFPPEPRDVRSKPRRLPLPVHIASSAAPVRRIRIVPFSVRRRRAAGTPRTIPRRIGHSDTPLEKPHQPPTKYSSRPPDIRAARPARAKALIVRYAMREAARRFLPAGC